MEKFHLTKLHMKKEKKRLKHIMNAIDVSIWFFWPLGMLLTKSTNINLCFLFDECIFQLTFLVFESIKHGDKS